MKHLWLIGLGLIGAVSPVAAQEDSRLVAAVRLAQDGQGDSARAIVLGLLAQVPASDTLYPQVVYTMGLVAKDAADRSRNFRRVAVEFAGSSWADDALLGLAEEDLAAGRADESAREIERLKADYPSSPVLPVAAFWATRAYFDLKRSADACRWLGQGLALAGEDIELQNQLNFYAPRCGSGAVAETPATRDTTYQSTSPPAASVSPAAQPPAAQPPSPSIGGPASGGSRAFAVQVAAAGTEAAAQSTVASLHAAGFESHLVREGGFVKVRVGRFTDRAQAAAAAAQIRAKLGGSPFVVEEP